MRVTIPMLLLHAACVGGGSETEPDSDDGSEDGSDDGGEGAGGDSDGDALSLEVAIRCPTDTDAPFVAQLEASTTVTGSEDSPLLTWSVMEEPGVGTPPVIAESGPGLAELNAHAIGMYTVAVTAQLEGLEERAECSFLATPAYDLSVELTWDTYGVDLDLHLARDGAGPYDTPDAASWCNKEPDWGQEGESLDDATLLLDNREGFGPENIHLEELGENSYTVYVHNYEYLDDLPGALPDAEALVAVWYRGKLVHTDTLWMVTSDMWTVGELDTATGTFTAVDLLEPDWKVRECGSASEGG